MHQKYEIWDVTPGQFVKVSIESIVDDWEGFRVLVRVHETDRIMRLLFDGHVAYQNRDESDLDGEAARSTGLGRGCFYKVIHSEFLTRFKSDSARQFKELKHFLIATDMDCIDVLATQEPKIDCL